ncbi:MAG: long-chain fatty acid--CoA ligase [Desulfobacteraceae bacterium]|nr:long-chain fatty acid--CoA ligase [Desulfobacteraceae bacterium]
MYTYEKPDNLVELIETRVDRFTDRPLFGTPDSEGHYSWLTYEEVGRRIDDLRAGMVQMGISAGDTVGVIARNRVEWAVAAFATFGLGGRFIPMYEKELPQIWRHIIQDGGITTLFVANGEIRSQIDKIQKEVPDLVHVIVMDGNGDMSMTALEEAGRRQPVPSLRPTPRDIAVLIYTSGTTGSPKGVLLSHGNLTSNFIAGAVLFPELYTESRSLSILPWAHSYGQTAELYCFINVGGSIGFVRDVTTIATDIGKVSPTFLIAVPRVFNKIYDGIWAKINDTGGLAKKMFVMGLESAAILRDPANQGSTSFLTRLKYKLVDRVVFSKIRQQFGGRLNAALTASAMMNQKVAQFFTDIGIPVYDAYGLTETSPAVTMNNREANRPGSVGRPIKDVRIVIDKTRSDRTPEEGEVLVYGPNVMQGYHNNPEGTQRVMTDDGGFRTGDLGRLDEEGYLFITGRIKEQYKLENGKYVFPTALEEEIQILPWVENVLIYGEGHSHNVCLVVPDTDKLLALSETHGLRVSPGGVLEDAGVHAMASEAIADHLKGKFKGYEIPRNIILAAESFSVDNGMLTQTLKLRRRKVINHFSDRLESVYQVASFP